MVANGKELWSGKRPFTLFDAVVTDDGVTGGYSYTEGFEGGRDDSGKIRIVVLDSNGKSRLDELVGRPGTFLDSPPYPYVLGILLVPASDCFVIRMTDPDATFDETWRVYKLSRGELLRTIHAEGLSSDGCSLDNITETRSVRGTPLILVHCFVRNEGAQSYGARFALLDPLGGVVWCLNRPDEYEVPGDPDAESKLVREIRTRGAVLDTQDATFEVRLASTKERVTFRVVRGDKSERWVVNETNRRPFVAPPDFDSIRRATPERPLKKLGTFLLGRADKADTPIRDVRAFGFDGDGRIGLVRGDAGNSFTFVIVNQTGDVQSTTPLGRIDGTHETHCAWLGGNEWLVAFRLWDQDAKATTMRIDVGTGDVTLLQDLDCPSIRALASCGNGGFVALVTEEIPEDPEWATYDHEVIAFGRDGNRRWTISARATGRSPDGPCGRPSDSWLLSPEDVAVTSKGEIAVLDVIRHKIQVYDNEGSHVRSVDLQSIWGREPAYPCEISAEPDGGVIIYDFGGPKSLVRMGPDNKVKSEIRPYYESRRPLRPTAGIRVSPAGRVWVSDGAAIMRLSEAGIVDKVLGRLPDADRLGSIARVVSDRAGRIYALDGDSGVVHVFDSAGRPLHICEPAAADLPGRLSWPILAVSDDGDVYLCPDEDAGPRYLHFDQAGRRIEDWRFQADDIRQELVGSLGKDNFLLTGCGTIYIVDKSGKAIRTIKRQPDRRWLGYIVTASVSPDGSFAVFVDHGDSISVDSCAVNIYNSAGEPIRTINLDAGFAYSSVAFDGRLIVLEHNGEIWLLGNTGRFIQRFASGARTEGSVSVFLHGHELWLVMHDSGQVERLDLP